MPFHLDEESPVGKLVVKVVNNSGLGDLEKWHRSHGPEDINEDRSMYRLRDMMNEKMKDVVEEIEYLDEMKGRLQGQLEKYNRGHLRTNDNQVNLIERRLSELELEHDRWNRIIERIPEFLQNYQRINMEEGPIIMQSKKQVYNIIGEIARVLRKQEKLMLSHENVINALIQNRDQNRVVQWTTDIGSVADQKDRLIEQLVDEVTKLRSIPVETENKKLSKLIELVESQPKQISQPPDYRKDSDAVIDYLKKSEREDMQKQIDKLTDLVISIKQQSSGSATPTQQVVYPPTGSHTQPPTITSSQIPSEITNQLESLKKQVSSLSASVLSKKEEEDKDAASAKKVQDIDSTLKLLSLTGRDSVDDLSKRLGNILSVREVPKKSIGTSTETKETVDNVLDFIIKLRLLKDLSFDPDSLLGTQKPSDKSLLDALQKLLGTKQQEPQQKESQTDNKILSLLEKIESKLQSCEHIKNCIGPMCQPCGVYPQQMYSQPQQVYLQPPPQQVYLPPPPQVQQSVMSSIQAYPNIPNIQHAISTLSPFPQYAEITKELNRIITGLNAPQDLTDILNKLKAINPQTDIENIKKSIEDLSNSSEINKKSIEDLIKQIKTKNTPIDFNSITTKLQELLGKLNNITSYDYKKELNEILERINEINPQQYSIDLSEYIKQINKILDDISKIKPEFKDLDEGPLNALLKGIATKIAELTKGTDTIKNSKKLSDIINYLKELSKSATTVKKAIDTDTETPPYSPKEPTFERLQQLNRKPEELKADQSIKTKPNEEQLKKIPNPEELEADRPIDTQPEIEQVSKITADQLNNVPPVDNDKKPKYGQVFVKFLSKPLKDYKTPSENNEAAEYDKKRINKPLVEKITSNSYEDYVVLSDDYNKYEYESNINKPCKLSGPYTKVFGFGDNNNDMYNKIFDKIDDKIVIVFGLSGSGKTYTLFGENGLVEQFINKNSNNPIKCKSVQIYKGDLYDTLKEDYGIQKLTNEKDKFEYFTDDSNKLKLETNNFKDPKNFKDNYYDNLKSIEFTGYEKFKSDIYENLIQKNRPVRSTKLNPNSSRSHLFIFFEIGGKTVTFVDLGGFEKPKGRNEEKNELDQEGQIINGELGVVKETLKTLIREKDCPLNKIKKLESVTGTRTGVWNILTSMPRNIDENGNGINIILCTQYFQGDSTYTKENCQKINQTAILKKSDTEEKNKCNYYNRIWSLTNRTLQLGNYLVRENDNCITLQSSKFGKQRSYKRKKYRSTKRRKHRRSIKY